MIHSPPLAELFANKFPGYPAPGGPTASQDTVAADFTGALQRASSELNSGQYNNLFYLERLIEVSAPEAGLSHAKLFEAAGTTLEKVNELRQRAAKLKPAFPS